MKSLMVIGGIIIAVSAIILLLLFIQSVKKTVKVALIEGEGLEKVIKTICIKLFIVGGCLFAVAFICTHMPRGFDSFFSHNAEGAYVSDDKIEMQQGDGKSNEVDVSTESADVITIAVEGKRIYFDERYYDDPQEFAAYLDTISNMNKIRIKDDYAVAATFYIVEEILDEKNIDYIFYDEAEGFE